MFSWRSRKPSSPPSRSAQLAAIPQRNPHVRELRAEGSGRLQLRAPVALTGLRKLAGGLPRDAEKTYELDELGTYVWERLDGVCTVEDVIRGFARDRRVNLREAEVAVLAFLQILARKNLVTIAASRQVELGHARPEKTE